MNLGKRIVIAVVGILAAIAVGTTAWDLGAGEKVFWGLPSWLSLAIVVFAAWWFPRAYIDVTRRPDVDSPRYPDAEGRHSGYVSVAPVLVTLLVFGLGWLFNR